MMAEIEKNTSVKKEDTRLETIYSSFIDRNQGLKDVLRRLSSIRDKIIGYGPEEDESADKNVTSGLLGQIEDSLEDYYETIIDLEKVLNQLEKNI